MPLPVYFVQPPGLSPPPGALCLCGWFTAPDGSLSMPPAPEHAEALVFDDRGSLPDRFEPLIEEILKAKAEIAELMAMKQQVEEMAELNDADINEQLFGRVTKRIVVHPGRVLEIHLSILPEPVFLKYETSGKGAAYNAVFDVIPNPNL